MAKNKKVTTVSNGRLRRRVDIYVTEDGQFVATVGARQVKHPTLEETKREVLAKMLTLDEIEWEPFIVVRVDRDGFDFRSHYMGSLVRRETSVELSFYRIELGRVDSSTRLCRPFMEADGLFDHQDLFRERGNAGDRKAAIVLNAKLRAEGSDVTSFLEDDGKSTIIPYTEARWKALTDIRARLDELSIRLEELLSQENAERSLAGAVKKLLSAG